MVAVSEPSTTCQLVRTWRLLMKVPEPEPFLSSTMTVGLTISALRFRKDGEHANKEAATSAAVSSFFTGLRPRAVLGKTDFPAEERNHAGARYPGSDNTTHDPL